SFKARLAGLHIGAAVASFKARLAGLHIGAAVASLKERLHVVGKLAGRRAAVGTRMAGGIRPLLRAQFPVVLAGVLGVSISATGLVLTQKYYQAQSQQEFEGPAAQYTAIVSKAVDRYLEVINSIGAFMAASNEVDRWEFFGLAESSLPRFPGIRTLAWVPRVTAEQRETYEKRAQADGLYGFRITERNASGAPIAALPRTEFFPVYYVEPFENNQGVLGYDLASSLNGYEALNLARESGQMIATRRVELLQGPGNQAGLLTVLPIYKSGAVPAALSERRENLAGFVLGVFRIGGMIEAALRELATPAGLDIYLYDEGENSGDRLLHYHPSLLRHDRSEPVPEENVYEGLYSATSYDVAGRPWSIVIKPTPNALANEVNLVPWNVAAVGLLLTTMLILYMVSSRNRTRIIERSVAERTAELVKSNTALEKEMQERARAEEVRAKLERELRHMQKMESLGTLAGGIAHEINTPVQYVAENLRFLGDSFAQVGKVLEKLEGLVEAAAADGALAAPVADANAAANAADLGYLRDEIPTSIDQSLEGIKRISEIVRAIKEFSHPDANEKSAIDINHAIETTITVARNQWKYVAEIETDFDRSLPAIPCLPGEFNQVMLNLIVNAAHAIEATGADEKGRITVSTREDGDRVEIRVSDTGGGIPEESREKIFDPFFTTKEPGKGTGQGLAISYTIITKKHEGTIAVESEVGKGSTFIICLPIDVEHSSDAAA
ncbi:MAG: CHASE domain-containing protein, partial [Alphaproteobacteria bacterium]